MRRTSRPVLKRKLLFNFNLIIHIPICGCDIGSGCVRASNSHMCHSACVCECEDKLLSNVKCRAVRTNMYHVIKFGVAQRRPTSEESERRTGKRASEVEFLTKSGDSFHPPGVPFRTIVDTIDKLSYLILLLQRRAGARIHKCVR